MKTLSDFTGSRKNNFDFIRFVAAAAVVFSHSYPVATGTNEQEPLYILSGTQTTLGGTGVSIFFIISGFLITQSFFLTKTTSLFFRSRALRIFPALAAMVLCTVFFIGPIATTWTTTDYFSSGETWSYLANLLTYTAHNTLPGVFTANPFPGTVNGSLWSLPYEVLFYITVPVAGFCFQKKFLPATVFLCIALALYSTDFIPGNYFLTSANCFYCGCMYYFFRNKIFLHPAVALFALAMLLLSAHFNFYNAAFGLMGGYLVLYCAYVINIGLENFARYGDFSYGIYIWAFPVQQLMERYTIAQGHFSNFMISFLIAFIIAVLSWHFVEKKSLRFKRPQHKSF